MPFAFPDITYHRNRKSLRQHDIEQRLKFDLCSIPRSWQLRFGGSNGPGTHRLRVGIPPASGTRVRGSESFVTCI